ncbi:hypothetical protein AMTRI_Chr12g236910 [Amborella trichopoda]|uniref:Uncharacterized protein n=1 Tax=Amborella trichopoda TaxID=13333 RepID=W1PSZ3_AMBTC|nr:hypothetical protein AMTR_s00026p00145240 [Amborella trichopoda]
MAGIEGLIECMFEGCLSQSDMGIERRPYHKNCSCALHKSKSSFCSKSAHHNATISYPIRRSWSEGSLASATIARSLKDHQIFPSASSPNVPRPSRDGNTIAKSKKEFVLNSCSHCIFNLSHCFLFW